MFSAQARISEPLHGWRISKICRNTAEREVFSQVDTGKKRAHDQPEPMQGVDMRATALSVFIATLAFPAAAAWHVDLVKGELVIIGSAEVAGGSSSFVSLRCDGDQIKISGETAYSANSDDELEEFEGALALIEFSQAAKRTYLPLPALLSRSVGNVVTLTVSPDAETSRAIVNSILQGNRLGFAAIHKDMETDDNALRVYSTGFSAVIFALSAQCPQLIDR